MSKPKILLAHGAGTEDWYVDAVESAGGIAVAKVCPEAFHEEYDGLILCGGPDVDPKRYGEEINGAVNIAYERDEAEFAVLDAFIKAKKPVLGICRGHQLLNVYFGGTLIQHLKNTDSHRGDAAGADRIHMVEADKGTVLYKLYSGEKFGVASFHHQAIRESGCGLKVTAVSEDGVIEAVEHESLPIFAVQFHPERMSCTKKREDTADGIEIFKYFVGLCK